MPYSLLTFAKQKAKITRRLYRRNYADGNIPVLFFQDISVKNN